MPELAVALGVAVDQQHPLAQHRQRGAEIHAGRGLSHAALLVGDGNRFWPCCDSLLFRLPRFSRYYSSIRLLFNVSRETFFPPAVFHVKHPRDKLLVSKSTSATGSPVMEGQVDPVGDQARGCCTTLSISRGVTNSPHAGSSPERRSPRRSPWARRRRSPERPGCPWSAPPGRCRCRSRERCRCRRSAPCGRGAPIAAASASMAITQSGCSASVTSFGSARRSPRRWCRARPAAAGAEPKAGEGRRLLLLQMAGNQKLARGEGAEGVRCHLLGLPRAATSTPRSEAARAGSGPAARPSRAPRRGNSSSNGAAAAGSSRVK